VIAIARALVQTGPEKLEMREFPVPTVSDDDAVLYVDRCGLCGTDVEQVRGELPWVPNLVIPGHEPVGTIAAIGATAAQRWGVQVGDRVIVEAFVPCRSCGYCAEGMFSSCPTQLSLGFVPISHQPALMGGFAQCLYLPANATVHKMSADVPLDIAPFYNALTCGVDWVTGAAGVSLGSTMVILGSGPRGIACGLVAKAVGAETVIMTGLSRDAHKLQIARELGIDATIDIERENLVDRVAELTGGALADAVIDVVPSAASTINDALNVVRSRGTVVVAGMKGENPVPDFRSDKIIMKSLTIKGVRGKRSSSYPRAISILESGRFPLHKLEPRTYPLGQALDAIQAQAGVGTESASLCVSINPSVPIG
jgi:threonine dehydrogenase-like Zn-dependent dehydrogenase